MELGGLEHPSKKLILELWFGIWVMRKHFPRMVFFTWKVVRSRILTLDNFIKEGKVIVNGYFLCNGATGTVKHLLPWCPRSYQLPFALQFIESDSSGRSLYIWSGIWGDKCDNKHLGLIPFATLWVYGKRQTWEVLRVQNCLLIELRILGLIPQVF